jgi:hypothetical protein
MALSVDNIYKFLNDLILKNQAGGIGNEKFERLWNAEQNAYQDDLLGRFQARSNGKTGANIGLIENETIMQKLAPFTTPASLTITSGNATKPDDFIYRLGLRINGVDCLKINHSQIANVNSSVIDTPSVSNNKYYFVEYEDYFYLLPHTLPTVAITTADLDYIAEPIDIKWGFTYDTDGRQVYNAGTSVQPLWADNDCREITKRVLKSVGVSFKDKDFENFGQSTITTGD